MIIIPNLGLKEIHNGDLLVFGKQKVIKINLVGAPLAAVNPSTVVVDGIVTNYLNALAGDNTQLKKDIRKQLEEVLTLQALDVSRIAGNNLDLYLQSGYKAKNTKGNPVGELEVPENIVFRHYGKNAGELQPDWIPVQFARNYTYQVYTNINDPEGSKVKEDTVDPSHATVTGLQRGLLTYTRVRANGGSNNHGGWSDPAERIVP